MSAAQIDLDAATDPEPSRYVNGEKLQPGDWIEVTADPDGSGGFVEHSPRIIRASEVALRALLDPDIRSLVERA